MRAKSWLIRIPNIDHGFRFTGIRGATPDQTHEIQNRMSEELGRVAAKWWDEKDRAYTESTLEWDKQSEKPVFSGWGPGDGSKTRVITTYSVSGGDGGSWSVTKRL